LKKSPIGETTLQYKNHQSVKTNKQRSTMLVVSVSK